MRWLLLLVAGAASAQTVDVVDVQSVRAEGDPAQWVHRVSIPAAAREVSCDLLVAGAGMGGLGAALRAAGRGHSVCLTEETDWIGGQATAGGVSALDENRFIETTGATRNYHEMRNRIRAHYRKLANLTAEARRWENLNPGACYVSSLCFEPKAGVKVLEEMLAPHRGRVQLMLRTAVVKLDVVDGEIRSAWAYGFDTKAVTRIRARWVLDATEMGDLLPLAGVSYSVGSEPRSDTGETHAPETANPACVQSFTYPFAMEHRDGENHSTAEPPQYKKFRDGQPFSLRMYYPVEFGWKGYFTYKVFGDDPPVPNNMSPGPFFSWRRLIAAKNFNPGPGAPRDLVLMNWPRQDYHDESVLDRTPADAARVLQQAKRVSFAFLHWLRTDVPRDGGQGSGYPGMFLRKDVMGTEDGLSKYPYIRESRRLRGQSRVALQDIAAEQWTGARARWFEDSVATGFYMIDIHPCGSNERGRMMMPRPFQVPMGALRAREVRNLLAAGKNLSVTHLANGAYRLHPIEWSIGEAAAVIASLELSGGASVARVQEELAHAGAPVVWFDDLPSPHLAFAAIQVASARGWYPLNGYDLHASPDAPMTRAEAAMGLARWLGHAGVTRETAIPLAVERGWMAVDHRNWFHADLPFYWTDIREAKLPRALPPNTASKTGPVLRKEWAMRLAGGK